MNQEPIQNRGESIPVKTSRTDWGQKEPFHGPYRLQEVGTNTDRICPVDIPQSEPILVSLDRLRRCPEEVGDEFWPPGRTPKKTHQSPARQAGPIQQLTEKELRSQESRSRLRESRPRS